MSERDTSYISGKKYDAGTRSGVVIADNGSRHTRELNGRFSDYADNTVYEIVPLTEDGWTSSSLRRSNRRLPEVGAAALKPEASSSNGENRASKARTSGAGTGKAAR
jgi:hypothetical protein